MSEIISSLGYNQMLLEIQFTLILFSVGVVIYIYSNNKELNRNFVYKLWQNKLKEILVLITVAYLARLGIPSKVSSGIQLVSAYSLLLTAVVSAYLLMEIYYYRKLSLYSIFKQCSFYLYKFLLVITVINIISLEIPANIIFYIILLIQFSILSEFNYHSRGKKNSTKTFDEPPINDDACLSSNQLIETRKIEFELIKDYVIRNIQNNSLAIAIVGGWGMGKTSIINSLLKDLGIIETATIFIRPMALDDRESLIKAFYSQLDALFIENRIYTGKGSHLEKYFSLLSSIINKDATSVASTIFENNRESLMESKASLQIQINELTSNINNQFSGIAIVVDDFDRVEKNNVQSVLTFINEIIDFEGCFVIFAMDIFKLVDKKIDEDYLEKFIYKRFDLKPLSFESIVDLYAHRHIKGLGSKVAKYNLEANNLFTMVTIEYIGHINKQIERFETKPNGEKEDAEEVRLDNLNGYKEHRELVNRVISNPRKVKRYLRDVVENINEIDRYLLDSHVDDVLINLDIPRVSSCLSFIKCFFEKDYGYLIKKKSIRDFKGKYGGIIVPDSIILNEMLPLAIKTRKGIEYSGFMQEKSIDLIDSILFNQKYEIVFNLDTASTKLLTMIDEDSLIFDGDYSNALYNTYDILNNLQYSMDREQLEFYYEEINIYSIKCLSLGTISINDIFGYLDNNSRKQGDLKYILSYVERVYDFLDQRECIFEKNYKGTILSNIKGCYDTTVSQTIYNVQIIVDLYCIVMNLKTQNRFEEHFIKFDKLYLIIVDTYYEASQISIDELEHTVNNKPGNLFEIASKMSNLIQSDGPNIVDVKRNIDKIEMMCLILTCLDKIRTIIEFKDEIDTNNLPVLMENSSIKILINQFNNFYDKLDTDFNRKDYEFLHVLFVYIKDRMFEFSTNTITIKKIEECYLKMSKDYSEKFLSSVRWDWVGVQIVRLNSMKSQNIEL